MPAFQSAGQDQRQSRKAAGKRAERRGAKSGVRTRSRVVARDDEGNVIGEVVAPVDDAVFGFGRGSVFLLRDH